MLSLPFFGNLNKYHISILNIFFKVFLILSTYHQTLNLLVEVYRYIRQLEIYKRLYVEPFIISKEILMPNQQKIFPTSSVS